MEMFLDGNFNVAKLLTCLIPILESINTNVPKTELSAALRRLVLANRGIVVLCGSSLKNKVKFSMKNLRFSSYLLDFMIGSAIAIRRRY